MRILLAVGAAVLTAASSTAPGKVPASAHCKSRIVTEGPAKPRPTLAEGELWFKNKALRMKLVIEGTTAHVLVAGDMVYQWTEGQTLGMKLPAQMARETGSNADYMNRLDEVRRKGQRLSAETVDGHPCDVYRLESVQKGKTMVETAYLARDRKGFPVRWVTEMAGVRTTVTNRDIQTPARVADALFQPPAGVQFQDLTTMMQGLRPPGR